MFESSTIWLKVLFFKNCILDLELLLLLRLFLP